MEVNNKDCVNINLGVLGKIRLNRCIPSRVFREDEIIYTGYTNDGCPVYILKNLPFHGIYKNAICLPSEYLRDFYETTR